MVNIHTWPRMRVLENTNRNFKLCNFLQGGTGRTCEMEETKGAKFDLRKQKWFRNDPGKRDAGCKMREI